MPEERRRPQAEDVPLEVVYEDEWMLALDKPAGMVVHPTYKNTSGTLLNGVLWRTRGRTGASPGILTRLDKDTSGLVVVGLTAATHAAMQKDGHAGRITKEYLAVVRGVPQHQRGEIELPLGRDSADRRLVVVRPDGQRACTRYEVVDVVNGNALLRCEPVTGRTHQIRVHLAAQGWPIAGDRVYGPADVSVPRQALHAWRVTLPHPMTRQPVELEAPIPRDLEALFQNFTL